MVTVQIVQGIWYVRVELATPSRAARVLVITPSQESVTRHFVTGSAGEPIALDSYLFPVTKSYHTRYNIVVMNKMKQPQIILHFITETI